MKTLSLVVPVFNEEKRISKTFQELKNLHLPPSLQLTEIIFINDGSTDTSVLCIKRFMPTLKKTYSHPVAYTVLNYSTNKGKGFAVRQGMLRTDADYALFFDADASTSLKEIDKFYNFIKNGSAVIIGTRKEKGSSVIKHQPFLREKLGTAFTKLANLLLGLHINDYTCGFKAFSKHARLTLFSRSRINRWGFDAEILYLAKQRYHLSITQVPITWSNDELTKVNLIYDIPLCMKELFKIVWIHRILPSFFLATKSFSSHKALKP